jgi:hypothetical protein
MFWHGEGGGYCPVQRTGLMAGTPDLGTCFAGQWKLAAGFCGGLLQKADWGKAMDDAQVSFARRMLDPIVREFAREIAKQRSEGATESDIQAMLDRVESANRPVMDPEQFQFFMDMFRKAAQVA